MKELPKSVNDQKNDDTDNDPGKHWQILYSLHGWHIYRIPNGWHQSLLAPASPAAIKKSHGKRHRLFSMFIEYLIIAWRTGTSGERRAGRISFVLSFGCRG